MTGWLEKEKRKNTLPSKNVLWDLYICLIQKRPDRQFFFLIHLRNKIDQHHLPLSFTVSTIAVSVEVTFIHIDSSNIYKINFAIFYEEKIHKEKTNRISTSSLLANSHLR